MIKSDIYKIENLLRNCNERYSNLPCCHYDGRKCNCYNCLRNGFYISDDTYECPKKICYYTMNYVPSYASETVNYLYASKVLENNFNYKKIKILSLGCGCAPELYAINYYIQKNRLKIKFNYHGIDKSTLWMRVPFENATFEVRDINQGLDISPYDIIFINKLFSTLHKQKSHNEFLELLEGCIVRSKESSVIIFNDINSRYKGRDVFDGKIKLHFKEIRRFYFDTTDAHHESTWIPIQSTQIVFNVPKEIAITPLPTIGRTVFFEYKK